MNKNELLAMVDDMMLALDSRIVHIDDDWLRRATSDMIENLSDYRHVILRTWSDAQQSLLCESGRQDLRAERDEAAQDNYEDEQRG